MKLLQEAGTIALGDIVEQFSVSEATARRDLESLEQERRLIRTFGGAVLETVRTEIPLFAKLDLHQDEKRQIADKALALIRDGDVIGLTGGSTTTEIARGLLKRAFERLTVITNAVNIAYELSGVLGIQLIVTGGGVHTQSFELSGPIADSALRQISIHKTFIGADGLSLARGVTTFNELEASTNRVMMEQSLESYIVADHTKLNHQSIFQICPLSAVTAIITDASASAEAKEQYAAAGIRLI